MTRTRMVVGAALSVAIAVGAGSTSRAAMTGDGLATSGRFPFAAEVSSLAAPTLGEWFPIAIPGIDDAGIRGRFSADDEHEPDTIQNKPAVAHPMRAFAAGSTADIEGEIRAPLIGATALDIARLLTPPEDYNGQSIDDLLTAAPEAGRVTFFGVANGDILVDDAVPALAALGLPVGGVLALGVVRRRRRTALARRVKLDFARRKSVSAR